jgi:hypothetical protein
VAVDDREAVAVVHRQRRDRPVVRREPEVLGDAGRVAAEVVVGQAYQLRGAGRPGRAEQEREIGVEVVGAALAPLEERVTGHDVGVPGVREPRGRVTSRCEQHDVAVGEGRQVRRERLDRVAALDQHQPAGGAEPACDVVDPIGQLGVGQPAAGGVDRDPVTVRPEVEHARRRGDLERGEEGRHARIL